MSGAPWTDEHRDVVLRDYGRLPVSMIAKAVRRSPSAVRNQAASLGLRTGKWFEWTTKDIAYLRGCYVERGALFVARQLRRRVDAVRAKASELGVSKERARLGLHNDGRRLWTADEDAQICACAFADLEAVARLLGRTLRAAEVRRSRVNRRTLLEARAMGP